MNPDDFQRAEDVARRSRVAAVTRSAAERIQRSARRSAIARLLGAVHTESLRISFTERIRLAGVLLFAATVTHQLLLTAAPPMVRPAAARLLGLEIATLAVAMIVLAGPIARAWPGSRLRRLLLRRDA